MRNRTELVTNQLGSDFEEEGSDFEADSGEDWKPEKEEGAGSAKKGSAKKTPPKRKAAAGKAKKPAKKIKKEESESDEEEEDDEEVDDEELIEEYIEEDGEEGGAGGSQSNGSKSGSAKKSKSSAPSENSKNFPDKAGVFSLYAYKGDLKNGFRVNKNICLWRRDGQSLLQKYLREKEDGDKIIFNSSMVYSCWEDRRADEFLEVKVRCCSKEAKDSRVELMDLDKIEQTCIDEKYAELNLEVYVSFADKKKQEGGSQNENGEMISQNDQSQEMDEEEEYGEDEEEDNEY